MATSARAETALAELSFNLQPVTSPRLHQDAPERTCTPQGKVVQSVATPQRTGESPLAPKDLNSPGAGLLLIDVEPSLSRECTPKGLLQPRTPSAFARSLLDRTPGMFKAQLGTPLIPLGTPVTSRKRPQRTPASTPAAAKENGTPAAVRRSARLASPCASPQSPRASPAVPPTTLSASPSLGGLRFSTTPRKGRSTPRKNATPAKPTEPTAVSFTLNGTATDVSPVQPASKTSRGPAVTPSRGSLAATSLRHSPFPAFSPSTPLIRTHDSYSDTELTDCDADGSIWEDDFEDPSFSYLSGSNETPVVDAFARLRVDDVPDASTLCSQDPPTVAHEDSVQLTATEVESASGSEAEDDDDSLELGTIAEEDDDDEVALDDSSSTSTSDVACDQSMPEAAPAETAAEELPSVEDAMAPPNEVAAAAFEGGMDGDDAAAIVEERVVSLNEIAADTTEARSTSDSPGAESALATPDVTETTEQPVVANEAPTAPPQETVPSSAPAVSLSPSSSTQEAVEPDAEVALAGPVAEDDDDRHDLEPIRADTADEPVPSSTTVEASVSTSDTVEETAEKLDAGRSASPSAELDDEPACPTSPNRSEPPTPPTEQTTPLRVSNVPETTTPAATPPRRPLTATVPTAQQPLGKAAPTARRQLTKLTSVTAQRPPASAKPGLTTLVPASSAAPRRLPVTSRLAVPKRIETSTSTLEPLQASTAAAAAATTSLPARAGPQPPHRVPASIGASEGARPPTGARRPANLSASTSSNSSGEQTRPVRTLGDLAAPARAPSTAGKSAERGRDVPVSSRLDRSGTTTRATRAPSSSAVRPAPMARRPFGGGPAAPQPPTTTFTASRPRVAVLRPTASGASAKPSLSKTASVAAAPGVESLTGKAPRAALAVRQTASAPSLAASTSGGPSPVKPRRVTPASATAAVSETPAPALLPRRARSPALAGTAAALTSSTTMSVDAPPPTPSVPPVSRSPLRASHLASPPRITSAQTQASPLRSPRRVPLSQQMQPGIVAPSANTSILVAPAQTVAAAAPAVFGSSTRAAAPPKMTRTTRRTAQPDTSAAAPVAAVPLAVGRPVRAAAMNATYSGTAAPGPPPGGRMARKITRRQQPTDAEETASAESTSVTATRPESAASSETTEETETGVPAPARALPIFRPAPVLTQVELNRLTQRNTKKNQQTFNQFKLETVFLDYDRPPSPTSKIRKSSSLANAASKEGREARAAKRRNALRASVDGSELEALSLELSAEDIDTTPEEHYRAPGDEEPYSTPSRTTAVVKCAKGGSRAAGSKKRTSTEAALDSEDGGKAARRVRWDRSLVYEGPREGYAKPPDASIIVIKSTDIDAWGNPTAPPRDLGKAVPVTIRMRVFKNDEK